MALFLGILLFSFILTSLAIIPFIDLLYKIRFTHSVHLPPTSKIEAKEFATLHRKQHWKIGTPVGGGILLITMVSLIFALIFPNISQLGVYITTFYPLKEELNLIFFTFISFGLLGLYDDIVKIFSLKTRSLLGLGLNYKPVLKLVLATVTASMLYFNLGIHIFHIPFLAVLDLGWLYIPVAALIIFLFTRAFDITDGLDGLASGLLLICLLAFWAVSLTSLDTTLSVFIALWIGSLIAFLYFNVYPARIWLGNAGSLSFGATLAVTGLLLGKTMSLLFIGGIFILEIIIYYLQFVSIRLFNRRIFSVTPLHYWLQTRGWPEPKVVMRLWLVAIFFALIGLWLAGA